MTQSHPQLQLAQVPAANAAEPAQVEAGDGELGNSFSQFLNLSANALRAGDWSSASCPTGNQKNRIESVQNNGDCDALFKLRVDQLLSPVEEERNLSSTLMTVLERECQNRYPISHEQQLYLTQQLNKFHVSTNSLTPLNESQEPLITLMHAILALQAPTQPATSATSAEKAPPQTTQEPQSYNNLFDKVEGMGTGAISRRLRMYSRCPQSTAFEVPAQHLPLNNNNMTATLNSSSQAP